MQEISLARKRVIELVLANDPHVDIMFTDEEIPHPSEMGFRRDIGEMHGQLADYRYVVGVKSIHAKVFWNRFEIHWDKVDPLVNGLEHLRRDSPATYVSTTTSIGAGAGAVIARLFTKDRDAIILGAMLGSLIGAIVGLATAEWD